MKHIVAAVIALSLFGTGALAQTPRPAQQVEFELMTWPEVKQAFAAGKTTALFYTGGTEQRGPQDVNGGHNLLGRLGAESMARKLGNAIQMPVVPYTPYNVVAARARSTPIT